MENNKELELNENPFDFDENLEFDFITEKPKLNLIQKLRRKALEDKKTKGLTLTEKEVKEIRASQRKDPRTVYFMKKYRDYLLSKNIRVQPKRAWEIFYAAYSLPLEHLIRQNKQIEYQGKGVHLSKKHKKQILHIYGLGTFEIKAVAPRRSRKGKRAVIKFTPSKRFQDYVEENVKVIDNGKG